MGAEQQKVGSALDLVQNFLEEIRGSEKRAETGDGSEPTELPYKGVSNNTQKASLGSRASENRSDVEKQLGSTGVTGQEDANSAPNNSEKVQGEMKRLTADDTAPQSIKAYPPKPGDGSGPGDETYGSERKYGSLGSKMAEFLQKVGAAECSSDKAVTSENAVPKKNEATPPATPPPAGDTKQASEGRPAEGNPTEGQPAAGKQAEEQVKEAEMRKRAAADKHREAAEAGYVAAHALSVKVAEHLKQSQDATDQDEVVQEKIAAVQEAADRDAQMFVEYMQGHLDGLQKSAEPEPEPAPEAELPPMPEGGDVPPMPEGGAEPPPMPAEGEDPEAQLEAIAAALEEAGVTPEDLAEAIAAVEQSGGEGMPEDVGAAAAPPIPMG